MVVSDEEKRWLVVGIAMNKVVAPVLRDFIKQGMDTHYANLDIYCSRLGVPCTLKTLTYHQVSTDPCFKHLKFQNVNNNLQLYGRHKSHYNYNINSSVDLAKLFVPDYLAEFSGFDESLDMSAVLRLLGCNKPAPIFHSPIPLMSIQNSADDVRENVRNKWGHCNVTDWTEVLFNDSFAKLETLVRSLGLTGGIEKTSLDLLSDWLTKGCQLCMGHAVDQNLLSLVQQDVKELIKNYKKTEAEQSAIQESLARQRTEQIEMQNTVTSMQSQQSSTRVQLQEHNELLEEMLEWKEQQMNEKQEIMAKLVSLEKTLSDELLIRVEGLEKRLAEADDKVEHLERGFAKRDDKMEQVEQGFAKTNDQMEELEQEFAKTEKKFEQLEEGFAKTDERVEQLERGFAKTDDKVEQLEQGFAKTDDKVEQLERGFAKADDKVGQLEHDFIKVEKDLSKTDDKVEQLEQGSAKTDNIVEQLERGFAKTGVKVGQLEHGLLKAGKDLSKTDDKVEQLEQGSAKTDNKVEQLQREFAKVENDVFETGNKVKQLEEEVTSQRMKENKPGSKTFLPRSNLPPKVPHFTGRQKECDEIVGHMTSESTRLVSVWGSPGFGKTSVAIAVGHHLQARELPVFFLSLRGLKSKSDLASKFLGLFRQTGTLETNKLQSLSTDDELCLIFDRLSDRCVIILDNADDLFECGVPNVKEEVINLIGEILNRSDKINFLLTTRESLSFLNLHFQGHMSVRIKELDKLSSQTLARELLPDVSFYHLTKVSQICGQVPLAIKLMCSSIPEDCARASQYIDDFLECTENIIEMLDNPDYPSNLRLKSLFQSSFQRLSTQDQEALVSLCILPDHFDFKIAAAVLGITRTTEVERILQRLQRKSLIDCCSNSGKITTHKLIQSFAREKGENDMTETVLISKSRFYAFYIGLFEKLNKNFLTGRSMSAFMEFFEDEKNIVQSLIEGCCDSKTADRVFDVLTKAELFLDSLFWTGPPHKIFDSAIMAAKQSGKSVFYRRLLISYAFNYVTWGSGGSTKKLLSESKELQVSASSDSDGEIGKYFCYFGIHECVIGKTETGVKALEKALSSLRTSPEHQILLLIVFQILAIYYQCKNDSMSSSKFYIKALKECRNAGDMGLLVIPTTTTATNEGGESNTPTKKANPLVNEPLQIHVIMLVREALGKFLTTDTKLFFGNLLLKIIKESVSELRSIRPGWLKFHGNAVNLLQGFGKYEDAITLTKEIASVHEKALHQSMKRKEEVGESPENHEEAIARTYSDQGEIHYRNGNYAEALTSYKRALNTRLKLFGEEHSKTADSYRDLGLTHHSLGDYNSALQSHKRALNIRLKLFGEEHPKTADSYRNIGITHRSQGDYTSALESDKRALDIRIKLSGEENSRTADSYHSVGVTQHSLGDYTSALESHKCALDIRIKLFDELRTADSYHEIGVTQFLLGDYASALESHKRALDIRIKLFGEEHPKTAESYHSVGLAQQSLGEYTSALESHKRALDIRIKLFGEEHPKTAECYHSVGLTQHSLGDYTSALE